MKKSYIVIILTLLLSFVMASSAFAADYFDTSAVSKGIIKVTCNTNAKMKLMIEKDGSKYTYDVNSSGSTESFPLQMGNGSYKISLLQNTTGSSYKLLGSTNVNLSLSDGKTVYTQSIQPINWGVSPVAVAKASDLTKNVSGPVEKAKVLWNYMVQNNQYDYNKLSTLPSTYIPKPDVTIQQKTGICYDFSSLYAAMLRSEGTPAKLVKGYAPKNATGYHAWNEVYDTATQQWVIIDTTYDIQVYPKNKDVAMLKKAGDFNKVYEY